MILLSPLVKHQLKSKTKRNVGFWPQKIAEGKYFPIFFNFHKKREKASKIKEKILKRKKEKKKKEKRKKMKSKGDIRERKKLMRFI